MYILPPSFSIPNNLYVSILKSCVTSGCPTTYAPRNRHESKPRSSFLFSLLSCFSFDQFPILSLSLSRLMDELRSRGGRGFNKSTSIVARTRRQTAEEAQVSVKSLSNGGRQHRLSRFPPPLRAPDRSGDARASSDSSLFSRGSKRVILSKNECIRLYVIFV